MKYSDIIIKRKIIPHLFFTRKGDHLFNSAKIYFNESGLNWADFSRRIEDENIIDENFWRKLIGILSKIYEQELEVDQFINILKENHDEFIEKLLILRFEYEFVADENISITDSSSFNRFITENLGAEENLIFETNDIMRILLVNNKTESGYIEPFVPGKKEFYPVTLIKLDKLNKKISMQGYKRNLKTFQNQLNKFDENLISKHEIIELVSLRFKPSYIFTQLIEKNIFIKKINLNCSYFALNVSVTEDNILDINEFINPEFVFNDITDLLKVKEIHFIYPYELENKKEIKEIIFKLVIDENKQIRNGIEEKYFKISLNVISKSKEIDMQEVEQQIIDEIETLGIQIDRAYKMPNSYYFSNMVNSPDNDKKRYYDILKEDDEAKPIINYLVEKNVISEIENSIVFNLEKYSKIISSIFNSLNDKKIHFENENFEVLEATNEKRRVSMRIKLSRDDKIIKYNNYYTVFIGFKTKYYKKEKIHNIILSDLNTYQILLYYLSKDLENILRYLYQKVKVYLTYNYNQLLIKEASRAHHWLLQYLENPQEFKTIDTATKSGYFVEEKINILLKYLFGNYLAIGGKNKPDGFICLKENKAYVVDSKQHKQLLKPEFLKVKEYSVNYQNEETLYDIKGGILLITKKIIDNNSLNLSTRENVLEGTDINLSFLSLEFILEIYEIFCQKTHIGAEISSFVRDCGLKVIEESSKAKDVSSLTVIENSAISELRRQIEIFENNHYPTRFELI